MKIFKKFLYSEIFNVPQISLILKEEKGKQQILIRKWIINSEVTFRFDPDLSREVIYWQCFKIFSFNKHQRDLERIFLLQLYEAELSFLSEWQTIWNWTFRGSFCDWSSWQIKRRLTLNSLSAFWFFFKITYKIKIKCFQIFNLWSKRN